MNNGGQKVSELAKRSAVTADAIRHYTGKGLLRPERDSSDGYIYRGSGIARVRFIRQAKRLPNGNSICHSIESVADIADEGADPFAGDRPDARLDEFIRTFFRNPTKGLFFNRQTNTSILAWMLDKDDCLFEDYAERVAGFVKPYLDAGQRAWLETHPVRLDYFDHDWTLNDLAQADGR